MGATERDLETALHTALANPKFQQFILRSTGLPGSQYSNTDMKTQWPRKPNPTVLDLRLDFKHHSKENKVVLKLSTLVLRKALFLHLVQGGQN